MTKYSIFLALFYGPVIGIMANLSGTTGIMAAAIGITGSVIIAVGEPLMRKWTDQFMELFHEAGLRAIEIQKDKK